MPMCRFSRTSIISLLRWFSIVEWVWYGVRISTVISTGPSIDNVATFGMCAALLMRRKQVLLAGLDDPFPSGAGASGIATVSFI
jgi:hypothetical protein